VVEEPLEVPGKEARCGAWHIGRDILRVAEGVKLLSERVVADRAPEGLDLLGLVAGELDDCEIGIRVTLEGSGRPRRQDATRNRDCDLSGLKLPEAVGRRQEVVKALEGKANPEEVERVVTSSMEEKADP
jgi:hypothetical protein